MGSDPLASRGASDHRLQAEGDENDPDQQYAGGEDATDADRDVVFLAVVHTVSVEIL